MANPDVSIENHFSLFLFRLNTQAASDWVSENVQPDAQFLGDALVVEPRYARELAVGMVAGGLEIC
jgi:hypothetical protein